MSFYHGRKEISRLLSERIEDTEHFVMLRKQVEPLVSVLQEVNPALQAESINWVTVADCLNCKRAHSHDIHEAVGTIYMMWFYGICVDSAFAH